MSNWDQYLFSSSPLQMEGILNDLFREFSTLRRQPWSELSLRGQRERVRLAEQAVGIILGLPVRLKFAMHALKTMLSTLSIVWF